MSEENTPISPAPEHKEEKTEGQKLTPGQQKRREKSVFQYITVLFGAAFLLLLFTFMMERRQNDLLQQQNQEQIDDLQQSSVTAVQSLNNLVDQNAALKEQVEALEQEKEQLEQAVKEANDRLTASGDAVKAMDWFWQIDEAYARGKYSLCRSLIKDLEEAGLAAALPAESITDNGRFSPADRYQEICDKVF